MRGEEQIVFKLGQLVGAEQRFVAHQQWRLDFNIPMLSGVQVKHELAQGAFKPGDLALEHDKPATREFGRSFKVHVARGDANLVMLLGREAEAGLWRALPCGRFGCAIGTKILDIVGFIGAIGHVVEHQIWNDGEGIVQFALHGALVGFTLRDEFLELGYLCHQCLSLGFVFLRLGLTNLLG